MLFLLREMMSFVPRSCIYNNQPTSEKRKTSVQPRTMTGTPLDKTQKVSQRNRILSLQRCDRNCFPHIWHLSSLQWLQACSRFRSLDCRATYSLLSLVSMPNLSYLRCWSCIFGVFVFTEQTSANGRTAFFVTRFQFALVVFDSPAPFGISSKDPRIAHSLSSFQTSIGRGKKRRAVDH